MYDVIIIGAGMAGASAGYFLASDFKVLLLEMEDQPGYHTTGRSAALYSESYGNRAIRALTSASRDFFENPPAGFAGHDLLQPRGAMFIGHDGQRDALTAAVAEADDLARAIDGAEACKIIPILRPDYIAGAVLEPAAMDIDVAALHEGLLRGMAARNGVLRTNAPVREISWRQGQWQLQTPLGNFAAPMIVNAAGAWCDHVARLAGVEPVKLIPKRRTAMLVAPPPTVDSSGWPMCVDVDEAFYFKPDAGKILLSPADETAMDPCDVQPDELDIAIAIDRVQKAADLPVRQIAHKWAGLRSFVADKTPVVGFDSAAQGFFWLAGQGGYGIQTAPALGQVTASLVKGGGIPAMPADFGVQAAELSPDRLR